MEAVLLGKRARLPTSHPRGDYRDVIDSSQLHRHVSADVLETLSPEQLAGPRDVLDAHESIVIRRLVPEGGADKSEVGVLRQPGEQECEVIRVEGDIGV